MLKPQNLHINSKLNMWWNRGTTTSVCKHMRTHVSTTESWDQHENKHIGEKHIGLPCSGKHSEDGKHSWKNEINNSDSCSFLNCLFIVIIDGNFNLLLQINMKTWYIIIALHLSLFTTSKQHCHNFQTL